MVDMELIDYDGDVESWFQDVCEQTKDRLEDQRKLYQKFNKKQTSGVQKKSSIVEQKPSVVKK